MTHPKAILCIDIDGTLINEKGQIHPHDIEILKNFPKAVQPILTTGRNIGSVKKIFRLNSLYKNNPLAIPGVFMNGSLALLPGEEFCTKHIFTANNLLELIKITKETKEKTFAFYSQMEVLLVNPNDKFILLFEEAQTRESSEIPEEIYKVIILSENPHAPDGIKPKAERMGFEIVFSFLFGYEINPPGINKASTLVKLTKCLHMENLPIYAVGDANNDLSLFNLSTMSFAPSSAQPAVLKQADHIIQRDKDGIFSTILDYMEIS